MQYKRWQGMLGGPQARMKASPGKLNKGIGALAGGMGAGTPQQKTLDYTGMQDPALTPGRKFKMMAAPKARMSPQAAKLRLKAIRRG